MAAVEDAGVDLISELRLRQWARRNYVPLEQRRTTWHPIVLGEMAFRDQELAADRPNWTMVRTPFVPLAPTDFTYLDEAHPGVPIPMGRSVENRLASRNAALEIDAR